MSAGRKSDTMSAEAALIELRAGEVGAATFQLVTDVASKLARSGRFSAPNGSRKWHRMDVDDLVGDFFASPGPAAQLAVDCEDGEHLRSRTATAVTRLILDRQRATPKGALRRRTARNLSRRTDVHTVPPQHWALDGFQSEAHWAGGHEPLAAAAARIQVDPGPEWDGERRTPACTPDSLRLVCDAVLNTAASPVGRPVVLTVVTDRIIPDDFDHVHAREDVDGPASDDPEPDADLMMSIDVAQAMTVAEVIFEQLDDRDRQLLAYLDFSARDAADQPEVQLGKSAASERLKRLPDSLRPVLDAAPDAELLGRCLLGLRDEWLQGSGQNEGDAP